MRIRLLAFASHSSRSNSGGAGYNDAIDTGSAQCSDYRNRKAFVPDCLRLTLAIVEDVPWLPATCAYRLRAAGRSLHDWHYLISGDREAVKRAGVSVAGRVVSENDAGPLEHHIVEWGPPKASAPMGFAIDAGINGGEAE